MKLTEHTVKKGEILIDANEKIHSFAIDNGTIFFYGQTSDLETDKPPVKYVVLETGDEIGENLHHVTTFVEGVKAKHLFIEYIPDTTPKEVTKIITDEGTETMETDKD